MKEKMNSSLFFVVFLYQIRMKSVFWNNITIEFIFTHMYNNSSEI